MVFALIIPTLLPFALLGIVMGLSWWEDRLLPPAGPAGVRIAVPQEPEIPTTPPETCLIDAA